MRIRHRTVVLNKISWPGSSNGSYQRFVCGQAPDSPSGLMTWPGYSDLPVSYVTEYMADTLGYGTEGSCRHRKLVVDINPEFSSVAFGLADSNGGKVVYQNRDGIWPYWNEVSTAGIRSWDTTNPTTSPPRWTIDYSTVDEADLHSQCLDAAKQLKADVMLNLIEANQMWPAIQSLAASIPLLRENWPGIRKVMKTASGAFLAWKFGISPVLSDIMKVYTGLDHIKKDYNRHLASKPFRVSKKAELKMSCDQTPNIQGTYNGIVYGEDRWNAQITEPPTIRYVLVAKPKVQYESKIFTTLDYALSRFSSSPANLAWERIPFSFMADWFVDIRGALDVIDKSLGYSPYELIGFTRSFSYKVITQQTAIYRETCSGSTLRDAVGATCQYHHYERAGVPRARSLVRWNPRFGKNQANITAALITQKLSSLRRSGAR